MRAVAALVIAFCTAGVAVVGAQAQGSTAAPQESSAQPPAAEGGTPQQGPAPAASGQLPGQTAHDNYTYQPDGRRDPFLNLLGTGAPAPVGRRGEGAAGLAVAEIIVRGVVQARGELLAMIQGPDNKTYIVHEGDKFVDGTVRSVTPQGLVIIQEVNDPLSLVKQREIQKLLRSQASAKE
ncbi:MAG TPA: hypothetical protein VM818_01490 [Vicinamibacterales bacterium]|jgi:Tfp pilus assembly protein PilP|nr:hypothetical protein [Vicinamibacterales bacterium]